MITALRFVVAMLAMMVSAHAAELTPLGDQRALGARLRGLAFPETLSKDLRSGLSNRVLIRLILFEGERQKAVTAVEIAVKYDLWDETFSITLQRNGARVSQRMLTKLEDVLAYLQNLELLQLFAVSPGDSTLTIKADVLLNPIERERMDRIREWVRDNSSYVPLEGARASSDISSSAGSNAVFNRIFEQYAAGGEVAQWRESAVSAAFELPR